MASFRLKRPHPDAVRFVPFFIGVNLIGGVHLPFFPAWLASVGFGPEAIGLLMMAMGLVRVVAGPALGFVADAFAARRLAVIALIAVAALSYGGYAVLPGAAFVVLFSITNSFAFSAIRPLIDGVMLRSALRNGFDYGRVVLFGSAAFIVTNLASGTLIEAHGIGLFLWIAIAVSAYAVAASFLLPHEPEPEHAVHMHAMWAEARALARQPVFVVFVAAAGIGQASHAFYYGFATLNWKAQGYSSDFIGFLWAMGVMAEIVLFSMSNRIVARLGPVGLLAAGGVSGVVRWTAIAMSPPLWLLMPVQCLHAGTFAATYLGTMHFIARAVPSHLVSTAQSLYAAIMTGLFMAGGQVASGYLFARYGAPGFLMMTAASAVALGLSLLLGRWWHGGVLALNGRAA